jgi:hypothetical protein
MLGGPLIEAVSIASSDASLLAMSAVLPTLLILYLRSNLKAKKLRPDRSLSRLERIELCRATLLYDKASRRREEIYKQRKPLKLGWRAFYRARVEFWKEFGTELQELDCFARDLRTTIMDLRERPLQRFKSWIHVDSARSALCRSLWCYCSIVAVLVALSYYPDTLLWVSTKVVFDTFVQRQPSSGLLLGNMMATGFVAVVLPPLYLVRRSQLYRRNQPQLRSLCAFAAADPDRLVNHVQSEGVGERLQQTDRQLSPRFP